MTWFKIDDKFHAHPKVIAAGNAAIGLWTRCGAWSADQRQEGFVPEQIARMYGTKAEIDRLTRCRMWYPEDGGYVLRDWLEYNPSNEQIEATRAKRSRAGRKGGIKSGETRRGEANGEANAEANAPLGLEAKSNPVPSRPVITSFLTSPSQSCYGGDGLTDDDFGAVVALLIADKRRTHPPTVNAQRWAEAVRDEQAETHGERIRQLLALGLEVEVVARHVVAGTDPPRRHRADCGRCAGEGIYPDGHDVDGLPVGSWHRCGCDRADNVTQLRRTGTG